MPDEPRWLTSLESTEMRVVWAGEEITIHAAGPYPIQTAGHVDLEGPLDEPTTEE